MKMLKQCSAILLATTMLAATTYAQPANPGPRGRGGPGSGLPPAFAVIDADGDGVLSKEELAKAGEALGALDADGDGVISAEEARPGRNAAVGQRGQGRGFRARPDATGPQGRYGQGPRGYGRGAGLRAPADLNARGLGRGGPGWERGPRAGMGRDAVCPRCGCPVWRRW